MAEVPPSRMIVARAVSGSEGVAMGSVWKTKYGMRRVRVDPPTLEEALYAAEGLMPDSSEQLQIAAELMHLPVETVRAQRVTRACTHKRAAIDGCMPVARTRDSWPRVCRSEWQPYGSA